MTSAAISRTLRSDNPTNNQPSKNMTTDNEQPEASDLSVSAGSDLCDAAEKLHEAFYTMLRDWRDGDFELPRYAELHMNAMESRAIRLGQVIYSIQNA